MNKYLFIIGFAGMALFTACSTADDLAAEKPIETPPVEEPKETTLLVEARQNSEIPITLGVGQSRGITRSPMNPDGEGNFTTEDGKYLGVFCLATGTQANESNIPTMIKNFKWNTAPADDEDGLIVRMRNVPAQVTTDGSTSNVVFLDSTTLVNPTPTQQEWYYPMGNWLKYNFYAYYPRQPYDVDGKKTLSFSENQVLETYLTIDGSQDVIWGRAHPWNPRTPEEATGFDPYCAKYFRKKRAEVGDENIKNYYPKFVFEHKLVQFKFFVKAANATVLTDLMTKNMQVTDMYIANAIYSLSLIVAQKDSTKNGVLKMKSVTPSTKKLRIKTNNADTDRFDQVTPYGDDNLDNPLAIVVELQADVALTAEQAIAYNSKLSGALQADVALDAAQATAYNTAMGASKSAGDTLTADEANAYNATLTGHKSANDTLTAVEAAAFNAANGYVGYIMLPDPRINSNEFKYQLTLKVKYTVNEVEKTDIIAIDMDPPSGGFIAGKIYNILVNVQSPEQISAKAILQEWDDSPAVIEYGN